MYNIVNGLNITDLFILKMANFSCKNGSSVHAIFQGRILGITSLWKLGCEENALNNILQSDRVVYTLSVSIHVHSVL